MYKGLKTSISMPRIPIRLRAYVPDAYVLPYQTHLVRTVCCVLATWNKYCLNACLCFISNSSWYTPCKMRIPFRYVAHEFYQTGNRKSEKCTCTDVDYRKKWTRRQLISIFLFVQIYTHWNVHNLHKRYMHLFFVNVHVHYVKLTNMHRFLLWRGGWGNFMSCHLDPILSKIHSLEHPRWLELELKMQRARAIEVWLYFLFIYFFGCHGNQNNDEIKIPFCIVCSPISHWCFWWSFIRIWSVVLEEKIFKYFFRSLFLSVAMATRIMMKSKFRSVSFVPP